MSEKRDIVERLDEAIAYYSQPLPDEKFQSVRNLADLLQQARREIADLRENLMDWEEREALVCPEDYSFEEVIAARDARIAELEGVVGWLSGGDTGMSSRWMLQVFYGIPMEHEDEHGAYPYDPSDFGRCHRFLQAFPNAKKNLDKLRESGPEWSAYIDHWGEMERLYEEERPTEKAPKLYGLMLSIREAAQSARDTGGEQ